MDFLTRLSLRRPVSTMLVLIALIVFGISSIFTFEMELQPAMTMPMIAVFVEYPGADPETVEKLVTRPIEEAGAKMQGMTSSQSTTETGSSEVIFMFDYNVDIDMLFLLFKNLVKNIAIIHFVQIMFFCTGFEAMGIIRIVYLLLS